jgi:hypothetical protein
VIEAARSLPLLVRALREPASMRQAGADRWELLIRQARRAGLLPRIALRLSEVGDLVVPPAAQAHLWSAVLVAQAQRDEVLRELAHIRDALSPLRVEPVLLKGAAYIAAGLAPAQGRLFTDIDLLLPKPLLPQAEAQLMLHGWATTHHTPYDQRYYRQWMHELPPLRHVQRQSVLDLHHAILPETARLQPDPVKLLGASVAAPDFPGWRTLGPIDMLLHSVSHLIHNDDHTHALRDLTDIDLLLRNPEADHAFWGELQRRAVELQLARPLHYVLRQCVALLGTAVPPAVLENAAAFGAPARWRATTMDALWRRALLGVHPSMAPPGTAAARGLLYVRAHWLRMPPLLLARHLTVKAFKLHEKPAD